MLATLPRVITQHPIAPHRSVTLPVHARVGQRPSCAQAAIHFEQGRIMGMDGQRLPALAFNVRDTLEGAVVQRVMGRLPTKHHPSNQLLIVAGPLHDPVLVIWVSVTSCYDGFRWKRYDVSLLKVQPINGWRAGCNSIGSSAWIVRSSLISLYI